MYVLNRKKPRPVPSPRKGAFARFLKNKEWEEMVREEMGLEELFSLCTNPTLWAEMNLWRQYILDNAWHQAIYARILEHVKALRAWPTSRMFNGVQYCYLPPVPGLARGRLLRRAHYEVLRLCYQEGLFASAPAAYGALQGPPPPPDLSQEWFWCHQTPDEVLLSPEGFQLAPDLPPALTGVRSLVRQDRETLQDMGRFPLLAKAGWTLSVTNLTPGDGWTHGLDLLVRPSSEQPHLVDPFRFSLEAHHLPSVDRAPGQVGPWRNLPPHNFCTTQNFNQPVQLRHVDWDATNAWIEALRRLASEEEEGEDE